MYEYNVYKSIYRLCKIRFSFLLHMRNVHVAISNRNQRHKSIDKKIPIEIFHKRIQTLKSVVLNQHIDWSVSHQHCLNLIFFFVTHSQHSTCFKVQSGMAGTARCSTQPVNSGAYRRGNVQVFALVGGVITSNSVTWSNLQPVFSYTDHVFSRPLRLQCVMHDTVHTLEDSEQTRLKSDTLLHLKTSHRLYKS